MSYKVLVLMSGGVDSSTAAALLLKQGYEVAGVYLKFYDGSNECWAQEMRDAARVAAKLSIPFTVWDVTKEYKRRVLINFYSEYGAGRTPNPDVLCNSEIKFGVALDKALAAGYDYVASGHYVRVHNPSQPPLNLRGGDWLKQPPPLKIRGGQGELCFLYVSVDHNKDQSYFLWRLTQKQLAHIIFPIGNYTKPQVRKMAKKFGLHNWDKKDSQGVCFLGKIKLKEFLAFPPPSGGMPPLGGGNKSGSIIDPRGKLLGQHTGLAQFTIGQRQGIGIGGTGPYYVLSKNIKKNQLVVGKASDLRKCGVREIKISQTNWIDKEPKRGLRGLLPNILLSACFQNLSEAKLKKRRNNSIILSIFQRAAAEFWKQGTKWIFGNSPLICRARVRYQGELFPVTIYGNRVIFDRSALAVASGQSAVFYRGQKVIGGGVIGKVLCREMK